MASPIVMKFGTITRLDPFTSQDGGRPPFWKVENGHISTTV